jgi:hypothetical protein
MHLHAILTTLAGLLCAALAGFCFLALVALSIWNARGRVMARGIVLSVDRIALGQGGVGTSRYEQRNVRMDVEIDGRPPFEVRSVASIPMRFVPDVLPGATVAIRIHPRRPGTLQVIGPGMAVPAFAIAPADPRPSPRPDSNRSSRSSS